MSPRPPTDAELAEVVSIQAETDNISDTARRLGLSWNATKNRLRLAALRGFDRRNPPEGFEVRKITDGPTGRTTVSAPADGQPFVLPVERRLGKVTTHVVGDERRVRQEWVRHDAQAHRTALVIEEMKKAVADRTPLPVVPPPRTTDTDLCTLYPIVDPHFGQLSWGEEAGEDQDLKSATDLVDAKLGDLIWLSPPSEVGLMVVLGDCTNANDNSGRTPASGHKQDEDTRYAKVIRAVADLLELQIRKMLLRHKRVVVAPLQGNHDSDAYLAYSLALRAAFRDNPRVAIEFIPQAAWYFKWGHTLMGFTHGHTLKRERMLEEMTSSVGEAWGAAKWRFFFSGHEHADRVRTYGLLKCRTFAAQTARSAWAAGNGMHATREFNSLTFHKETGPYSEVPIYLPPPPQRKVVSL